MCLFCDNNFDHDNPFDDSEDDSTFRRFFVSKLLRKVKTMLIVAHMPIFGPYGYNGHMRKKTPSEMDVAPWITHLIFKIYTLDFNKFN